MEGRDGGEERAAQVSSGQSHFRADGGVPGTSGPRSTPPQLHRRTAPGTGDKTVTDWTAETLAVTPAPLEMNG